MSTERTAMGLALVLVAVSGFVAGTSATFTAGAEHPANTVASASLVAPSADPITLSGSSVRLSWTASTAADNANAGTRVAVVDLGRGSGSVPASCGAPSTWATLLDTQATAWSDVNTTTAPHTNFSDGRIWCYRLQSIYPFPAGARPWSSVTGNPTVPVAVGHTLVGGRLDGDGDGVLAEGDVFELWFSQAVDPTKFPLDSLCADSASGRILIGVNGSTTTCPKTTNPASSKDTRLSGFWLSGGTVSANGRWAIASVTGGSCPAGAPEVCWAMRVTVGARSAGSDPAVGGSWTARGTANTAYLAALGGTRTFCAAGAATTITGLTSTFQYRNNPTAGWCATTLSNGF